MTGEKAKLLCIECVYYWANDRDRTGDLNLGKVALYQLSHIRMIAAPKSRDRM